MINYSELRERFRKQRRKSFWGLLLAFLISGCSTARAEWPKGEPIVDLRIIAYIESGNDPSAIGENGDYGLYQITQICLDDFNKYGPVLKGLNRDFTLNDMLQEPSAFIVARWYLGTRIPQMLEAYHLPLTPQNVIWAWNAGIGNVKKGYMPKSTELYIKRYWAYQRTGR